MWSDIEKSLGNINVKLPSTRWRELTYNDIMKFQEKRIDLAFRRGVKLIINLLSKEKIDSETANVLLELFLGMYVVSKSEKVINEFVMKLENSSFMNQFDFLIEED